MVAPICFRSISTVFRRRSFCDDARGCIQNYHPLWLKRHSKGQPPAETNSIGTAMQDDLDF
jgi:hypothetical protein